MKVNRTESCIVYSCSLFHLRGIMSISGKDSIAFYKGHFWPPLFNQMKGRRGHLLLSRRPRLISFFPVQRFNFPANCAVLHVGEVSHPNAP